MDKYHKIKKLGHGRYGDVWLVERSSDSLKLALKIINLDTEVEVDPELNAEVAVLAKLNHPHIVKYYESFVEDSRLFIVMDYAEEGDLRKYMNNLVKLSQTVDEDIVWKFAFQLSQALHHIHTLKIIHRDIKPQNIFLKSRTSIMIGDFGISKILQNTEDLARTSVGTPHYVAPEVCGGKGYDNKADIWGLGCLLYELCTLKKAFDGDCIVTVVNRILTHQPEPISSNYSGKLKDLIFQMLNKNPAERPSINTILQKIHLSIRQEERKEILRPTELDLPRSSLRKSYQKEISINIPTPTYTQARRNMIHPSSAPSKSIKPIPLDIVGTRKNNSMISPTREGAITQKASSRHFSFSESLMKMCPTSPNRPMLMCDFLMKKLGSDLFERVKRVLNNTKDPARLLREEPWIISDICGEENLSIIDVGIAFNAFSAGGQVPFPPTSTHRAHNRRAFSSLGSKSPR